MFHGAILLWVAGLAHWASGNVDLGLMANILIGSIPGVLIGTHLIVRVPANVLRPMLACVLLGSALGVLKKAGADVPAAAIVGVPALTGVFAWWLYRRTAVDRIDPPTSIVVTPGAPVAVAQPAGSSAVPGAPAVEPLEGEAAGDDEPPRLLARIAPPQNTVRSFHRHDTPHTSR